jgi:diguanylate cyclase (GGDEF)-like protein
MDITALKRAEEKLAAAALSDTLTGLPNRRALDARLELLGHEAQRGRRYALAIIDIDHFKKVNDTHGHAMGDRVLVAVGGALREAIRKHDLAARMGGEEFCVVLADVDPEQIAMLAERLRSAIAAISEPLTVTASIGVCHSSLADTPNALLEKADAALYRAKSGGRNRVELAS